MPERLDPDHANPAQATTSAGTSRAHVPSGSEGGKEHRSSDESDSELCPKPVDRRTFLQGAVASVAALARPGRGQADVHDLAPVWAEIEKRHDEAVTRLQEWIRQPSIAA